MLIRIFCVLMSLVFSYDAYAVGACSEPSEPECAGNEETYKSKEEYAKCTSEFQAMSLKTKEYTDCIQKELKAAADDAQKKVNEATDKANAAMKKFNCKANPKATC